MNRKLFLVVTLILLLASTSVIAQQLDASQRSYQQARRVLDDAIEAHGGLEALRAIKDFTLKEKGKLYARYQSPGAEPPYAAGTSEETLIVDNDRGFVFDELKTANVGFNNWNRTVIKGTEGQNYDMWSKTVTPVANPSINNFRGQIRRLPPFVLLEALDRAATLRWVGEDEIGGKRQKVISVIRPDNQQLTLSFDAQTKLLTGYGYLYADPIAGDAEIAQTYSGYRTVGKLKLPSARVLYNSGGPVQEVEYTDLQINTRPADNVFQGPDGFEKLAAPPATPAPPTVTKVADDVYLLEGLNGGTHNAFFVAFNDYVLVIEAPEQIIYNGTSTTALKKIKETVPGKPIKYLVLTHHHSDHAGGFREYVAEGATIVTTATTKSVLEKAAAVDSSLLPNSWPRQKLTIETVENKKRVFQDDKHVVELYDIGPNPHANEILVAYLPKEKILFQADMLNAAPNGTIPIAQDVTLSFSEKLQQLGLDVEKIYAVHGRAATPQELRTSVEKRRASDLKIGTN
ncbi:MAG TPA: MBL fold metallo-hydrolase [Pyrinomonadaceae bacterium]|nr:MBL fold metallo-hydrolase [Pyrinomonadaceae bacterium]